MNKGWLELESDPGVFTLLVEDFGVQGVQVEEIYDLQKPIEGPVYGFIFLFRWIEERRSRRKITQEDESFVVDDKIINSMFFAHQVIANSCATHALLSVLLNCENKIKLGDTLTRLKYFTKDMSPEDKGHAISNMPDLARAHNSHARPEPCRLPEKQQGISSGRVQEAFHFVSYVPINGHLFELDGLKPYPIDHGPGEEDEDWTAKFCKVISERLGMATGEEPYHDIRYALMAVVPDRRLQYEQKLKMLRTNRATIVEALRQSGKDESQLTADHKKRPRTDASGGDTSLARHSLTGDQASVSGGDASSGVSMPSSSANLGAKRAANCLEASGDAGSVKPLSVETQLSESPAGPVSGGSTTDTASEVASLIHSPGESSSVSTVDSSFECRAMKSAEDDAADERGQLDDSRADLDNRLAVAAQVLACDDPQSSVLNTVDNDRLGSIKTDDGVPLADGDVAEDVETSQKVNGQKCPPPRFSTKELARLLKRVDAEINNCEACHRDEIEKRRKYKIDDCRRTHNYDQFICTFLSMLAEQGQLAGLVEQHMLMKRRQGSSVGRLHKTRKTVRKKRIRHKR